MLHAASTQLWEITDQNIIESKTKGKIVKKKKQQTHAMNKSNKHLNGNWYKYLF